MNEGSDGTFRSSILMQVNLLKVGGFLCFGQQNATRSCPSVLETNMHMNSAYLKFHLEPLVISEP